MRRINILKDWSQSSHLEMCKNKKNETNPCTFKNEYGALKDRYRDHIPIFTDGSKEGNKVGYAVRGDPGWGLLMELPGNE